MVDQPERTPADVDLATLRALVASAPDGIVVVDDDGRIVQVNPRAEAMFGYPAHALAGRPVEILVPEREQTRHIGHRAHFATAPLSRPMGAGLELLGRRRDGGEFPIDVSLSSVVVDQRCLYAAFVRDVTTRVEADNALRASEQRFKSLVDSVPDYAIFTLDPEGMITSWGVGAERLKGYTAAEAVGQSIAILYSADDRAAGLPAQHLADAAQGPSRLQGWRVRRDGSRFWADVSLTAFFEPNGKVRGYAKVTRDLTEQRLAETRLQAVGDLNLAVLKGGSSTDVLALAAARARELANGVLSWAAVPTDDGGYTVVAADGPDAAAFDGQPMTAALAVTAGALGVGGSSVIEWPPAEAAWIRPLGQVVLASVADGSHFFGVLAVSRARDQPPFTSPEMRLVEVLAAQAAGALALRAARLEVERLGLAEDQERIARDLHDTVIQRLFATAMTLQSTLRSIESEAVRGRIDQAIDDLDDTIRGIRTTIFGLQPSWEKRQTIRQQVLAVAVEAAASLGFEPAIRFEGAVDALIGTDIAGAVVPTVRETLANIARHARATEVVVTLQAGGDVTLIVRDNGVGVPDDPRPEGHGLTNMAQRAHALGGSFRIERAPGGGTRVEWRVPVTAASD
jgi:PAS domain S-box-containing protein